jgi:hypothetical protein
MSDINSFRSLRGSTLDLTLSRDLDRNEAVEAEFFIDSPNGYFIFFTKGAVMF